MAQKIPATVVTGFLGAGKTTLIRHMLQNAQGKRIALIINEFGDLGVDGDILKGCGDETCTEDDIMELSNGCICCTVADDFIPTMQALLERENKPDHIVIETSGLALPQPLIRAFNWPEISTKVTVDGVVTVVDGKAVTEGRFAHNVEAIDAQRKLDENLDHETPLSELYRDQIACAGLALPQPLIRAFNWPEISTKVTVDGVVTVVDGKAVTEGRFAHNVEAIDAQRKLDENLDHETPLSELYRDQIACADMIVVNKSDLLTKDETAKIISDLKTNSREGVQVVTSTMGALPIDILLGQGVGAEGDLASRHEVHHHHDHGENEEHHHHDHDHDDFESFVVDCGEIKDEKVFAIKIADIIRKFDILRLKGFIAVEGKPMRMTIQAVGPRVDTYFDQPFGLTPRQTKIVVIGQAGLNQAAIISALTK